MKTGAIQIYRGQSIKRTIFSKAKWELPGFHWGDQVWETATFRTLRAAKRFIDRELEARGR